MRTLLLTVVGCAVSVAASIALTCPDQGVEQVPQFSSGQAINCRSRTTFSFG